HDKATISSGESSTLSSCINSRLTLRTPLLRPENCATKLSWTSSIIQSLDCSLMMVKVRPSKETSSFLSLFKSPETRNTRSSEVVAEAPSFLSTLKRQKSPSRSEEHTSELQSRFDLVCRPPLEKKNNQI